MPIPRETCLTCNEYLSQCRCVDRDGYNYHADDEFAKELVEVLDEIANECNQKADRFLVAQSQGTPPQCVDCPHSGDKWCNECYESIPDHLKNPGYHES